MTANDSLTGRTERLRQLLTAHPALSLSIAFSGIDGSGKSTQLRLLHDWLTDAGAASVVTKVVLHGTSVIFRLSQELFGDPYAYHPAIPATQREFVVACDVVAHYTNVVAPQLRDGLFVLWDRGRLCYRVYARAYEADITWIEPLYQLIPAPDLTFLLDVDPRQSQERLRQRSEKPLQTDESSDFLTTVRSIYLEVAESEPNVRRLDGSAPAEQVQLQVCDTILQRLTQSIEQREETLR